MGSEAMTSNNQRSCSIMSYFELKHLVLLLLVVQNTFFVLLMRYSRTRPGDLYLSSTAVCCDEGLKLITCLFILTVAYFVGNKGGEDGIGGECSKLNAAAEGSNGPCVAKGGDDCENEVDNMPTDTSGIQKGFCSYMKEQLQFDFRVAGIALLYVVQKNLLYLAVSNLDAAVFQVTYQLKILTTALFSVLLLKRSLSHQKIVALMFLTLGVALVQLDKVEGNSGNVYQDQSQGVGLVAVLGACCTSGFAGVYFELVLKPNDKNDSQKQSPPRPAPSVWAKNVQLSTYGLIIGLAGALIKDFDAIATKGFFQGYNGIVVGVIALQAFGGLVVAAIIKYADNILKNFATAVSIVTSTIVSASVFGFSVSTLFVWGCIWQFFAIYLYSMKEDKLSTSKSYLLKLFGGSASIPADSAESDAGTVQKHQVLTSSGTKDDEANSKAGNVITSVYTEFPRPSCELGYRRGWGVERMRVWVALFLAMAAMSGSILYFEVEEDNPPEYFDLGIHRGDYEEAAEVSVEPGERMLPFEVIDTEQRDQGQSPPIGRVELPIATPGDQLNSDRKTAQSLSPDIEMRQLRVNKKLKALMKQRIEERRRVQQLGTAHDHDGIVEAERRRAMAFHRDQPPLIEERRKTAQNHSPEEIEMNRMLVSGRQNERMKQRIHEMHQVQHGQRRHGMP